MEDFEEFEQGKDGRAVVSINLMNFNGVNYANVDPGYMGPWGEIKDAKYDIGKAVLSFTLVESLPNPSDNQKLVKTGRVLEFKLDRNTVFPSMPRFQRFQGDVVFKKNGVEEEKGGAKFDGHILDELPSGGMGAVWDAEADLINKEK